MPRTPIIVTLDDKKQHLVLDGEITGCGQVVPQGLSWETETTRRCTTCFPGGKVEDVTAESESELIEEQQEVAGKPKRAKASASKA